MNNMINNKSNRITLNSNWMFALYRPSPKLLLNESIDLKPDVYLSAQVPGTIHTDLMNHNIIDDPFYSDNETRLEGIDESDWIYKNEFQIDPIDGVEYQIVFDGLDTHTETYINNNLIGSTVNMFCQYKFDISKYLLNGNNEIKIIFKSPIEYCAIQENKYGKLPAALNSSRVYLRKAQYSFGWDWGPILTTSGIWKNVFIEQKPKNEISDIRFNTISIGENEAVVEVKANIKGESQEALILEVSLSINDVEVKKQINVENEKNKIKLNVTSPKLWSPNGEGEQNLYKLSLKLFDSKKNEIDRIERNVGIRTIELIEEKNNKPDFAFKVNGKKIFAKGVNWIPADSFLPRVSKDKYFNLLKLAKDGNMNIIRAWGGGIYENDEFYEYCDQLGLLVWQDFMFACGAYPEHEEFITNVEEEVSQNISRLQYHPSIAMWCGNNENEWGWYQDQISPVKELPGYKIYNSIIPNILKAIDHTANYWQSSPFGNDKDPNSTKSGNTHHWDIWSFWKDYTEVINDDSLFVTEFGFQGPANIDTFNKYIHEKNRKAQDSVFEFHNKQVEGPERLFKFLSSHLPVNINWADFIYLTQLNQGFALKTCLEHWRTNNTTNGSIIWQLNDCWPVTSWSIIDSDSRPKLSYHFVKEIFSPTYLSFSDNGDIEVVLHNDSINDFSGTVKINVVSSNSGKIMNEFVKQISVSANSKTSIIFDDKIPSELDHILVSSSYDGNNKLIHRNFLLKKKWKHVKLNKSKINIDIESSNGLQRLIISSDNPNFFVDVYHPDISFNKRGFILLPNEKLELEFDNNYSTFNPNDIQVFTLNNYLCE